MKQIEVVLARLKELYPRNARSVKSGRKLSGPDYYGCMNSGKEPTIARAGDMWRVSEGYSNTKYIGDPKEAWTAYLRLVRKVCKYNDEARAEV